MNDTPEIKEDSAGRHNQDRADRRGKDRRENKKPYTGPERRKHERRDQ